ncbi:MAG: carbohydrate porin [Methylococcaceae bacterium]|nr:carbohydrate porin [Methylococcaceae bacterium]MDP3904162.1 carbohydrate porin [Methylococcaceae bacterium]
MKTKHISRVGDVPLGLLGAVLLMGPGSAAHALGPVEVPPTWGGDLSSRPRLTGDWGGTRDELGKKGVVLGAEMMLLPGGVVTGGKDTNAEFWGNVDYTLNLDTEKMGLWPGGFFKFEGVSSFGNTLYNDVGAFVPSNVTTLFPGVNQADSGLMQANYTQFLSTKFGVVMGKMSLLEFTPTEFYGNYHNQFMNSALNFSLTNALVPLSAYGGGILFLPTKDVTLMALALDASGTPSENDVSKAFDDGATVLSAAKINVKPFGLVGHQSLTGVWSNKTRLSLDQDPSNVARMLLTERYPRLGNPGPILTRILERFFPQLLVPVQPLNHKDNTWVINYAFDQYLWQPEGDSKRGIGLFFNFGATDGNPNPVQYSYMMGIGGKGPFQSRSHDSFGIGWARTQFSDQFVPLLRERLGLGLDHEDAIEMYYTAAVTPWLSVSPNLQVINSGLNKTLDQNNSLKNLDTSVEASLRMTIQF